MTKMYLVTNPDFIDQGLRLILFSLLTVYMTCYRNRESLVHLQKVILFTPILPERSEMIYMPHPGKIK